MFMFKADFFEAWLIVPVLLIAYIFQGEATFLGSVFTANKKTNVLFISTLAGSGVNVVFNLMLIPKYGNIGAALATLTGYIVICVVRYSSSRKIIPLGVKFLEEGLSVAVLIGLAVIAYCSLVTRLLVGILGIAVLIAIQWKSSKFLLDNVKRLAKKFIK